MKKKYNDENGIVPVTIKKKVHESLEITKTEVSEEKTTKISIDNVEKEIERLKGEMQAAAYELNFELAAKLRDTIKELEAKTDGK